MNKQPRAPLTNEDGEVRLLQAEDVAAMRPAKEVLSPELYAALTKRKPGERGPGKKPAKRSVTLRLDPDLLEAYQATGPGWHGRMAEALSQARPEVPASEGSTSRRGGDRG